MPITITSPLIDALYKPVAVEGLRKNVYNNALATPEGKRKYLESLGDKVAGALSPLLGGNLKLVGFRLNPAIELYSIEWELHKRVEDYPVEMLANLIELRLYQGGDSLWQLQQDLLSFVDYLPYTPSPYLQQRP